jgi:hypothetical protein
LCACGPVSKPADAVEKVAGFKSSFGRSCLLEGRIGWLAGWLLQPYGYSAVSMRCLSGGTLFPVLQQNVSGMFLWPILRTVKMRVISTASSVIG